MPEMVMVDEPDLLNLEIWLASNPPEDKVDRWLMAIIAYFMRKNNESEK